VSGFFFRFIRYPFDPPELVGPLVKKCVPDRPENGLTLLQSPSYDIYPANKFSQKSSLDIIPWPSETGWKNFGGFRAVGESSGATPVNLFYFVLEAICKPPTVEAGTALGSYA
jgi:hypothetical protein